MITASEAYNRTRKIEQDQETINRYLDSIEELILANIEKGRYDTEFAITGSFFRENYDEDEDIADFTYLMKRFNETLLSFGYHVEYVIDYIRESDSSKPWRDSPIHEPKRLMLVLNISWD